MGYGVNEGNGAFVRIHSFRKVPSGEATHPAMAGKSCVTSAGPPNLLPRIPETLADHTQPLGERDLVCDGP